MLSSQFGERFAITEAVHTTVPMANKMKNPTISPMSVPAAICYLFHIVSRQILSIVVLRIFGNPEICGQQHLVDFGLGSEGGSS